MEGYGRQELWTGLVQQWGVPVVEPLQLQKSIEALMREIGPRLGDLHWGESTVLGRESKVLPKGTVGMLDSGGCSNSQEAKGPWLLWREGSREVAGKQAAGVGSQGVDAEQEGHRAGVW